MSTESDSTQDRNAGCRHTNTKKAVARARHMPGSICSYQNGSLICVRLRSCALRYVSRLQSATVVCVCVCVRACVRACVCVCSAWPGSVCFSV